jgi:phosphoribosyl 1,2-cyclic phosphodiesterase
MRFSVLGSGSGGNATVVEAGGLRLLVDAGLSAKQLVVRMQQIGIDPASLHGVLLTHEHGDHIRGLKVLLKQFSIPVFATHATSRVVQESGIQGGTWKLFEAGQPFAISGVEIDPFSIQHDAVDPVGFVIAHLGRRLGVVSDAGFVTRSMTERLRNLHTLFVEANYDDELLEADTKRPWSTKQRISSRHGHLSNKQVAELLCEIAHPLLSRIVLGHLSSDCNCPNVVLKHLRECLEGLGHMTVDIHCARQEEPSDWFAVGVPSPTETIEIIETIEAPETPPPSLDRSGHPPTDLLQGWLSI